jgi:hypothetical protein
MVSTLEAGGRRPEIAAENREVMREPTYNGDPPHFDIGIIVDRDALVVDKNGTAWFVSPAARQIIHAETRKLYQRKLEA